MTKSPGGDWRRPDLKGLISLGVIFDRTLYYYVKRVPERFKHVDPRSQVRIPLRTDSRAEAMKLAPQVEAELFAHWEALAAGEKAAAAEHYEAARNLARARGFVYRPIEQIAAGPLNDLLARLEDLARSGVVPTRAEAEAILGAVPEPSALLSKAFEEYERMVAETLAGKSAGQLRRWRLSRLRAVTDFIDFAGDLPMDQITREVTLEFRQRYQARVLAADIKAATANKQIGYLSTFYRTWCELKGLVRDNPFASLRLKGETEAEKHPFSRKWIAERLLAPGALAGLNAEARHIFLAMVNTGLRPSEIIGAAEACWRLDDDLPHLQVRPAEGRSLKTTQSKRDMPLVGVSLEAARLLRDLGGVQRYVDTSNTWSGGVNKFLTENGLRETPQTTAYSLRHSFEDSLLEAGVDERLRATLMGHKYKGRAAYGVGGSLELLTETVRKIAF